MIVINADMHPMGDADRAYPLVRATIINSADSYFARVLVRPWVQKAILGRDVTLRVHGFQREQSADRLIATVLEHSGVDTPGRFHRVGSPCGDYQYEIIARERLSLPKWDVALDAFRP